jgi:transposase InsO family protein
VVGFGQLEFDVSAGRRDLGRPGLALVVLSVVEQRLDAVRAVLAGATVTEVAVATGVSRSTLHRWIGRYLAGNVAGLTDRSHRPTRCPHQAPPDVEVAVAEMRRKHPRWGSKRIRMQLLRVPVPDMVVPSARTINRILLRHGLAQPRPRKRPKDSFLRFERPAPMQLWQVDIVGGLWLVNPATGELREAKIVTGVDDHSRFCVMAKVVERATARAVCVGFAEALARFGVPEEVQSDNGKQFTDRFGKGGEVMFDRICRKNGIKHRLTDPFSPNQNGKIERFHGTLRPDFLDPADPFTSLVEAQTAVDAWVADYNSDRPHQALDDQRPVTPADRFRPVPEEQRQLIQLWLPPTLEPAPPAETASAGSPVEEAAAVIDPWAGGPVELDQVVPPSGNMWLAGRQFWLGPARAGLTVRFWASTEVIHLSIAGARVKSTASHLTVADLAKLVATGARNAGPAPIPTLIDGAAVEVDRTISPAGTFALGGHVLVGAAILACRRVGIRIEPTTLLLFDPDTRTLLRTRPNPLSPAQVTRLRGARPAGPPPRPALEPVRVQRLVDHHGTVSVCGQRVSLGRAHARRTLTIAVSETTLAVELGDGDTHIVRRTTTSPAVTIKARSPRTVTKT